jgi:hypothetical protein
MKSNEIDLQRTVMNKSVNAKVVERRLADDDHAVTAVEGGEALYRREPCAECPWRRENVGTFPAEAFRLSARTCYDGALTTFACHMSGTERPAECAGFLLRNADHNVAVRMYAARGKIDLDQVSEGDAILFASYREMAVANGVDPDDPVLKQCRGNDEEFIVIREKRKTD